MIKEGFLACVKFVAKNDIARIVSGMLVATGMTATVCSYAYKRLETKHRKEDAERYKREFTKRIKEIEDQYKHNEYVMKQKINDVCKEFGIDPMF